MFRKKQNLTFDKEKEIPILRCSICTGEQVAGFKNIHTGKIKEVMLIKEQKDLEWFQMKYGVKTITKQY